MSDTLLTISIVSYNNIKVLKPCLESIYEYHNTSEYEIIVVAYLFSEQNLAELKASFPKLIIIESNEIRGFSENNNLALRIAKGAYSLILNDDTYFVDNSIAILLNSLQFNNDVSIVSPLILNVDNTVQANGREKYTFNLWVLTILRLKKTQLTKYHNKRGFYPSYNIHGCCFLIKTSLFKELGYFDEYFFFSPEDIALGTKLLKNGHSCFVNTDAKVYHLYSATAKPVHRAILPVTLHGFYYYFRTEYSVFTEYFARFLSFLLSALKLFFWKLSPYSERKNTMIAAHKNILKYSFIKITPKKLFTELYVHEKKI